MPSFFAVHLNAHALPRSVDRLSKPIPWRILVDFSRDGTIDCLCRRLVSSLSDDGEKVDDSLCLCSIPLASLDEGKPFTDLFLDEIEETMQRSEGAGVNSHNYKDYVIWRLYELWISLRDRRTISGSFPTFSVTFTGPHGDNARLPELKQLFQSHGTY